MKLTSEQLFLLSLSVQNYSADLEQTFDSLIGELLPPDIYESFRDLLEEVSDLASIIDKQLHIKGNQ